MSPVVSRESPKKRLCVAATGDAAKNELVVFDATTATPNESSVCARISPPEGMEAVDLDLTEESEEGSAHGTFALAYCTDFEVHVCRLKYDFQAKKTSPSRPEPVTVYKATPSQEAKAGTPRPKIRCLRWLSPHHLLVLQKSGSSPAELVLLNLKSVTSSEPLGKVNLRKSLPKSLEVAAHLDICKLDADPATGEHQILVAVAGADRSRESAIHIYTLNHIPTDPDPWKQIWKFTPYTVLNRVHPSNIMRITFSNFFPPRQDPHSTMSVATPSQHVHLASVAWGGTVVIETLTLTSTPTTPHDTNVARNADSNPRGTPSVRWVLISNSITERLTSRAGLVLICLAVLLFSILAQSYLTLSRAESGSSALNAFQNLQPPGARAITSSIRQGSASASRSVVSVANNVRTPDTGAVTSELYHEGSVVSSVVVGAASAASSAAADVDLIPGASSAVRSAANAASSVAAEDAEAITSEIYHEGKVVSSAVRSAASAASFVAAEFNPIPGMQHRLADLLEWRDTKSHSSFSEGPNAVEEQHYIHVRAGDPSVGNDGVETISDANKHSGAPSARASLTASLLPKAGGELTKLRAEGAKRWEELSASQQATWKRRLHEAGEYSEGIPESLLKGVLWSEFANVVGGGIRDAVLG